MSSPLAIYKLIVLYLLDRVGGEIAMDRLSSFLLERGYVNFVSLLQTYAEIEKSGLVTSRVSGDRCFYSITSEGRQTLKMFSTDLGPEIRQQADSFLIREGAALREDPLRTSACHVYENRDLLRRDRHLCDLHRDRHHTAALFCRRDRQGMPATDFQTV